MEFSEFWSHSMMTPLEGVIATSSNLASYLILIFHFYSQKRATTSRLKPEVVEDVMFCKENAHILQKHYEEVTGESIEEAVLPGIFTYLDEICGE